MAEAAPPPTLAPPFQVPLAAPMPFTPLEQLPQLQFCINSNPSWYEASILAFQHYIVMLGTTVLIATLLVPSMGGSNGDKARVIQTLLFMSGINTYLQTILGTRLPTVMNASFAFMIPVASIVRDFSARSFGSDHERFLHTMREIQGALIISSLVNILIGFTGAWKVITRLFSPVVISPLVCVAGLGLFRRGFPQVATCVEIGLPMLIAMVIGQQYLKCASHRLHFRFERFAMLFCIAIIWAFAAILTASGAYNHVKRETKRHCRTDMSYLLSSASWIKIPYPFQWGMPTFSADHVFGMMGAAVVSCIESTGTHFAAARLAGATPPPTHVLSRSFGLQGLGLLLEGMFGTLVGTAASAENAGLLGLTRIGSRRVTQISTIFMIFFSIFGKFGAFFASIPLPMFAAIYCILFGLVAATGVTFIQFINQNSMRNIYILGLALFLGISIPEYFYEYDAQAGHGPAKTNSGWFNDIINAVFSSAPTVVILVGTLLDSTLEAANAGNDRGLSWWHPFQRMKGDVRNEEFYRYPIRVHDIVPSRFT